MYTGLRPNLDATAFLLIHCRFHCLWHQTGNVGGPSKFSLCSFVNAQEKKIYMNTVDYIRETTGLLLVDPYNDFLAPEGKFWPKTKEVAEKVNLLTNLKSVVDAARQSGIRIFVVPPSSLGTRRLHPLEARDSQAARHG
jgi:hypothetical protein